MFRGKQALPDPPDARCAECGKDFPFNEVMAARVAVLAVLGITPAGFVCEPCALASDLPAFVDLTDLPGHGFDA